MAVAHACDNCEALFRENADWNDYEFEKQLKGNPLSFRLFLTGEKTEIGERSIEDYPDLCPKCVNIWVSGLIVMLEKKMKSLLEEKHGEQPLADRS